MERPNARAGETDDEDVAVGSDPRVIGRGRAKWGRPDTMDLEMRFDRCDRGGMKWDGD